MNVGELYYLSEWFAERHPELSRFYQELQSPLQHNANQPDKQPLEQNLDILTDYLGSMSFAELSMQQLDLLSTIGIDQYIGPSGKNFVNSTVRVSHFDPATAVQRIEEAIASINSTHKKLAGYRSAVNALDVDLMGFEEPDDFITIRVGFRNDASIENITDWKNSGKDWYDIIRGLSLASGEPPESTRVIGAGTGSIILFLAATATVTTLLAIISKNVMSVAKNIIDIQSATEELRQKKILTKLMEQELSRQVKELKDGALTTVLAEVKGTLPTISGEAENALSNSIKKLLAFNEKGGNVDFVSPDNSGDEESGDDENTPDTAALAQARAAIHDYQASRDEIRLITASSNND
jgi:hypothetical protein